MARKKLGLFDAEHIDKRCPGDEGGKILYRHGVYGLGLSVDRRYGSTRKDFFFEGKIHGRTIRMVIGKWPDWTVEQAEKKARNLRVKLDSGIDPREEIRMMKAAAAREATATKARRATLRDAWEAYLAHRATSTKPLSPLTLRDYQTHLRRSFEDWAEKKLVAITEGMVLAKHKALLEKSGAAQANQAMRYLRAVLNFASKSDQYAIALGGGNPVRKLTQDKAWANVRPKKMALRRDQLRTWWEATDHIDNLVARTYMRFLLLSGCRREEALSLRWEDLDFRWASIAFRDTKTGGDRVIPMTRHVGKMLAQLPKYNRWVFGSTQSREGRMREPAKYVKAVADKTGIWMSSHGLRKSFITLSEWIEIPAGVIREVSGHAPGSDVHERHYKQRSLDLLAVHLQRYEDWLLTEAGQSPASAGDETGLRVVE